MTGWQRSSYRLEDYRCGRLEIHIHLRVRFGEFEPEQWCAVYKRSLIPESFECAGLSLDSDIVGNHANGGDVQKAVLVSVVEFAELPERHEPMPGLESIVRLRSLDGCAGGFAKTRDHLLSVLVPKLGAGADRERQTRSTGGGSCPVCRTARA